MDAEFRAVPIDETSVAKLAALGLEFRLVDAADHDAMERFVQAETRGFLGKVMTNPALDATIAEFATFRRNCAVYDPSGPDPLTPVATINSWIGPLTMPGGREIDAWAISGVTVAPTHRRRGIQRQMMEAELRTAAGLGIPLSMLTVSESQIYGRYGYGPAVIAAKYKVDTRRLTWIGSVPEGRVDFIPVAQWRDAAPAFFERIRLRNPGQVSTFDMRWDQMAGYVTYDGDKSGERRCLQFTDAAGEVRGLALYRIADGGEDFEGARVIVDKVFAETPDAYAALWRFFIEMDLVTTVTYDLGSSDEPFRWMVSDFRAVTSETYDMHYLRVLDAAAVLPADVRVEVADPLGFASGTFGGEEGAPAEVSLDVVALSSILVGGVAVSTLQAAGRIVERAADAASRLGDAYRSEQPALISFWY